MESAEYAKETVQQLWEACGREIADRFKPSSSGQFYIHDPMLMEAAGKEIARLMRQGEFDGDMLKELNEAAGEHIARTFETKEGWREVGSYYQGELMQGVINALVKRRLAGYLPEAVLVDLANMARAKLPLPVYVYEDNVELFGHVCEGMFHPRQ